MSYLNLSLLTHRFALFAFTRVGHIAAKLLWGPGVWLTRAKGLVRYNEKIWIPVNRGAFEGLDSDKILFIEADNHHVKIFIGADESFRLKHSLKDFHRQYLSKHLNFYQLTRSYIINLNRVLKIENLDLHLEDGKVLKIPKNRRDEVFRYMGIRTDQENENDE